MDILPLRSFRQQTDLLRKDPQHKIGADLPIEEAVRFALAAAAVTAASVSPVAKDFSAETIHGIIKEEAL